MSDVLEKLGNEPTWRLVEHAVVGACALYGVKKLFGGKGFAANVMSTFLSVVKAVPGGQALIDKENEQVVAIIRKDLEKAEAKMDNRFGNLSEIPDQGISRDQLMEVLKQWRSCESGYRAGKQFGGIYSDDKSLKSTINEAMVLFQDSNGLYPTIFPALRKMEMEVVHMTKSLLHGTDDTCGTMTTGGTESICMSIMTHKKWAKAVRGIEYPEAIVPVSAHAAFAKGCNYFGVKLVTAPLDESCRVDVKAVERLINSNTIMLVGSAPTFPQGVIDPIAELGQLAKRHRLGLHVDSCLGGFLLPWLVKLGHLEVEFDFAVEGVTAMSADIHKFGFGPKQSSVILYATHELRKHQFFAYSEWTGGVYASPSFAGSRAGGTIAAAWATLVSLGADGYKEKVTQIHTTFTEVLRGLETIPELRILGPPQASGISFGSNMAAGQPFTKATDVFKVADAMSARGWFFPRMQNPVCCMVQIGARSDFDSAQFVSDMRECVAEVVAQPDKYGEGMAKVYGMAASVPDRGAVNELLVSYLDAVYS